jgi:Zn-dependent M28 family amino/carboxypeptidase
MRGVRLKAPAGSGPSLLLAATLLGAVAGTSASLRAQQAAAPGAAAASPADRITARDLRSRVRLLADDSMRGRDTPSPQLTAAAKYVADQFRSFGLRPALGDSYLQYYPVTVIEPGAPGAQRLVVNGPDGEHALRSGRDFVSAPTGTGLTGSGPLRRFDPDSSVSPASGAMLLVEARPSDMPGVFASIRRVLREGDAAGAIIVVDAPGSYFEGLERFFGSRRVSIGEPDLPGKPVALVAASVLPAALRGPLSEGQTLPYGWTARLETTGRVRADSAMNVIGWLPGSDPDLQSQYVLFTAHLDHVGVGRPVQGDSIYNGADDDASGTATVLELARAYARAPERPRRSLVFMTVSGEEKGLLGSSWYTSHPVFPLERTVADVNIDMIGRNWKDTVAAIGKKASTLGQAVDRVVARHPELGMTVVADPWPEQKFFTRSDHYNFARKGIPVLFFSSGLHEDYRRPSDEADRIEYDKMARIARLLYYLGARVGDADQAPRWDPDAYRRLVSGSGSR